MEGLLILLGLGLLAIPFIALGLAVVALARSTAMRDTLRSIARRLDRLEQSAAAPKPEPPPSKPEPVEPPRVLVERLREPAPVREPKTAEPVAAVPAPPPEAPVELGPPVPTEPGRDWWAVIEEHAGKRWMTWVGALTLFLSAGFFVKYAIDREWLSPAVRVLLGAAFGLALAGLGIHFLRLRKMRALGQGLTGAGIAVLYVSLYAAFGFYQLIGQPVAFVLMVAVSAAGIVLASMFDAMPISFISVLGGFLTPVMVSTGHDQRDLLFTYLLILDLSVLTIGFFRKWRALDVLAFTGTAVLYILWFHKHYQPAARTPALLWVGAFYAAFLILPFVDHLRRRTAATIERFVMALANGALAFAAAHCILYPAYPHVLGWIVLAMAASCAALGGIFRTLVPQDRRSVLGFIGLAMTFATVSIALHFELNGMTLAFGAEAAALLFLGFRFRYLPARIFALLVLGMAVARLFAVHMPLHDQVFTLVWNTDFGTAICVPLACWLFAAIHHANRRTASETDRTLKVFSALVGGILALVVTHVELAQWFAYRPASLIDDRGFYGRCAGLTVWAAGCVAFVAAGVRLRSLSARVIGVMLLTVVSAMAAMLYNARPSSSYVLFGNIRFLTVLTGVASCFAAGLLLLENRRAGKEAETLLARLLLVAGGILLLILMTSEILVYRPRETYAAQCAVTALWSVGVVVFLGAGLYWRNIAARLTSFLAAAVGLVFGIMLYSAHEPTDYLLFVNTRFGAALAAVLVLFAGAWGLRAFRDRCATEEQTLAKCLYGAAILLLLVLLSAEVFAFCRGWVEWGADAEQYYVLRKKARWLSQMALTITWSVYALALLAVGFGRRARSLRFAALALFAIAAGKLLIYDIAGLTGLYRITVTVAAGALMIGASYLYHRIESGLDAKTSEKSS